MADKEIFVPSPEDFTRATGEIAQDIHDSGLGHRVFFKNIWSNGVANQHRAHRSLTSLADIMLPKDRATGGYFEHARERNELALLGFAAGALYIAKVYSGPGNEVSNGETMFTEAVSVIGHAIDHQLETNGLNLSEVNDRGEYNQVDVDYEIAEIVRHDGASAVVAAGEVTAKAIEDWSERATPIIAAQSYFVVSAGLLIGASQLLSESRAEIEHERRLSEFEVSLKGLHDVDWDESFNKMLKNLG